MPSARHARCSTSRRAWPERQHQRASSSTTSSSRSLDAAGHRGPDADQGHRRLPGRRRDRQPRDGRLAGRSCCRRHFDQVTPENHMKPEAWYDADRTFAIHPEATAIMDFAQDNDLDVYGHTLVWHSQTPAWFFQDATPARRSPNSEADQQILRDRLRDHIFDVAETLSTAYGLFGSDTNPLVAFDVVNEVVSDGASSPTACAAASGTASSARSSSTSRSSTRTRRSTRRTPPPAPTARSPVHQRLQHRAGRQAAALHALVERLLARGVPVGRRRPPVPRQPVDAGPALEAALVAFEDLPVTQAVTELDVTTGTPVTQAQLIEQGYYYRDAFRIFRAHADDLFSVTVWGLTDGRQLAGRRRRAAPLRRRLQAKPAYYGAVDGELPAGSGRRTSSADVATSDIGADPSGSSCRCTRSRRAAVPAALGAGPPDARTSRSTTPRSDAADRITFVVGDTSYMVRRDGTGDVPAGSRSATAAGSRVAHLPLHRRGAWPARRLRRPGHRRRRHGRLEQAGRGRHAHAGRARCRTPRSSRPGRRRRSTARSTPSGPTPTRSRPTSRSRAPAARRATSARCGRTRRCTCSPRSPTPRPTCPAPTRGSRTRSRSTSTAATSRTGRTASTTPRSGSTPTTWCRSAPATRRSSRPGSTARRRRTDDGYVVEAVDQPARVRRRRHVPRPGLPGQRRVQRRPHVDPNWADPTGHRLPDHGPLGRGEARRDRCEGADRRCDRVAARRVHPVERRPRGDRRARAGARRVLLDRRDPPARDHGCGRVRPSRRGGHQARQVCPQGAGRGHRGAGGEGSRRGVATARTDRGRGGAGRRGTASRRRSASPKATRSPRRGCTTTPSGATGRHGLWRHDRPQIQATSTSTRDKEVGTQR